MSESFKLVKPAELNKWLELIKHHFANGAAGLWLQAQKANLAKAPAATHDADCRVGITREPLLDDTLDVKDSTGKTLKVPKYVNSKGDFLPGGQLDCPYEGLRCGCNRIRSVELHHQAPSDVPSDLPPPLARYPIRNSRGTLVDFHVRPSAPKYCASSHGRETLPAPRWTLWP
jgi:hypothetical protein